MDPVRLKKLWKSFNKSVNDLARCVVCSRSFEHEVHMCSQSHNICHSCFGDVMIDEPCTISGCSGRWLPKTYRNLAVAKLSRLRITLYASRADMVRWCREEDELPWLELIQCVVCYGVFNGRVYMCQNGHNWCQLCEKQILRVTGAVTEKPEKCPLCNEVLLIRNLENATIENICKGMAKADGTKAREPVRLKGIIRCPMFGCDHEVFLRTLFGHLSNEHPQWYSIKVQKDWEVRQFYHVATVHKLETFTAALKIYGLGLFVVKVKLEKVKGKLCISRRTVRCLNGFHEVFHYILRLEFRYTQHKSALSMIEGWTTTNEKEEPEELAVPGNENLSYLSVIHASSELRVSLEINPVESVGEGRSFSCGDVDFF